MNIRILIVYDNEGNIIYTLQGGEEVKKSYSCTVAEIGENEIIESINTVTGQVIVKEKEPSELEKLQTENEELTDKVIELTAQNLENAE
ncbi:hypothetical protein [Clostridium neonatale]|uniref:Uncharacterized protein n=1 Tax=Clostridium neonatale TaxID=137838 RepID=A0AAD1YJY4_9CLOT|nr:hypothetical protein [Clostridium neonatale]CAI3193630.1 conserved hypothetical protein [Clostridium neonatale]CAI3213791.1 conserved hypothetical protein [Clostridium neonatale]CAI3215742.1 conserved hypothetical protein [Clostridium neonatale]CAI3248293.1 conserved hypothetical protein [Clostridium neonatale]CAI3248701.1 conserved hypothetical protein [Clostridium neonatale]